MRQYPLLKGEIKVGSVTVVCEGLFCRITCVNHSLSAMDDYIIAYSGNTQVCLGKCTQESGVFILRRFMKICNAEKGELTFCVESVSDKSNVFVPLDPLKPFQQIAALPHAKFIRERTKYGIALDK